MATDIQIAGASITYADFEIEVPTSPADVAPSATVTTTAQETISAGDSLTITIDGTTVFEGETRSAGEISQNGQRRVEAYHTARNLFEETVSFSLASPTAQDVLQAALDNSSRGANYTLDYPGTPPTLNDDYSAENRGVKRVFRDMADRTGCLWRVDPAGSTIHFETTGARGTWESINTTDDRASLRKWDAGDIDSVRNVVTIIGTYDERVEATAENSTSISDYGRRPGGSPYNVSYIRSATEAQAMAQELLVPNPRPSGELLVSANVGNVSQSLVNYTADIVDNGKNVDETGLVIESQTIKQGHATLKIGLGPATSIEEFNRSAKSDDDLTDPGGVQPGEITETKIADDAVTTPKIFANAVTADEIDSNTITANEIDTLDLETNELRIGDPDYHPLKFGTDSDAVPAMLPSDGRNDIGLWENSNENDVFSDISAEAFRAYGRLQVAPVGSGFGSGDSMSVGQGSLSGYVGGTIRMLMNYNDTSAGLTFYDIDGDDRMVVDLLDGAPGITYWDGSENIILDINGFGGETDITPGQDNTGSIGTSTQRWANIYAASITEGTPRSITHGELDTSEILNCDWDSPPEYIRYHQKGLDRTLDEGCGDGMPLGALANYLFEVTREQEGRINDLEQRLSKLEEQI